MENSRIFELLERLEASPFRSIKYSDENFSIEVSRDNPAAVPPAVPWPAPVPAAGFAAAATTALAQTGAGAPDPLATGASPAAAGSVQAAESETAPIAGPTIDAPLVGTFYRAPAPDQPPYVSAGQKVAKGQVVCLVEAMKMMNEIPAPCDCVIEEVLKADGKVASYGDALFRYRPC